MAPYPNDMPYNIPLSSKKKEISTTGFRENFKKLNLWQLVPLSSLIKIFQFQPRQFLYFIDPQLHAKFKKK